MDYRNWLKVTILQVDSNYKILSVILKILIKLILSVTHKYQDKTNGYLQKQWHFYTYKKTKTLSGSGYESKFLNPRADVLTAITVKTKSLKKISLWLTAPKGATPVN